MATQLNRRKFIRDAAVVGGAVGLGGLCGAASPTAAEESLKPIGQAKGIHPGHVVWVHDPKVLNWKGPGDGQWYEPGRIRQDRIEEMMRRAVCDLTGQPSPAKAWDRLFRHLNQVRGKADAAYRLGEKVAIKPNWVGMIWREGHVDAGSYTLKDRKDYMNTAPQLILALLRQLESAGVAQADISICDTLAYLVHEYYDILHAEFPEVRYVDYAGKFGRIQVKPLSAAPFWSCRPQRKRADCVPSCFAEAEYLINFANLKAHVGTGVTLCGKNHFGSLVRWPVQEGYYEMHGGSFSRQTKVYREQVDLMGHAQLGGKTVLYLIDGLLSGVHPIDPAPRNGPRRRSTGVGRRAFLRRKTLWPLIRSGWISPVPNGNPGFRTNQGRTIIFTKRPWRRPRRRGSFTIPTTLSLSNGWPAWVSTSIGTMPRTRNTLATWGRAKGSSWLR